MKIILPHYLLSTLLHTNTTPENKNFHKPESASTTEDKISKWCLFSEIPKTDSINVCNIPSNCL